MSVKVYSVDEIIGYAREHSKYYADLYRDVPQGASLEELPLVDQDDFWAHCDEHGGTVATREQVDGQIFKSGGTTGNPKYSLYSAEEWETICEYSGFMLTKGGWKMVQRLQTCSMQEVCMPAFCTHTVCYILPRQRR